jgi:hypothetical protein
MSDAGLVSLEEGLRLMNDFAERKLDLDGIGHSL